MLHNFKLAIDPRAKNVFFSFFYRKAFTHNPTNESRRAVLSCGAVCYAVQGGSNF